MRKKKETYTYNYFIKSNKFLIYYFNAIINFLYFFIYQIIKRFNKKLVNNNE